MEYHRHSQLSLLLNPIFFLSLCAIGTRTPVVIVLVGRPLITDISRRLIVGFRSKRNRQCGCQIERRKIASLYRTEGDTHPLRARQNSPSGLIQSRRTDATEDHAVKMIVDPTDVTRRFFPDCLLFRCCMRFPPISIVYSRISCFSNQKNQS